MALHDPAELNLALGMSHRPTNADAVPFIPDFIKLLCIASAR